MTHTGPCVSDFVVSSYTPTISTLLDKIRWEPTSDIKRPRLLLISQTATPGLTELPATQEEVLALANLVKTHQIESLTLGDDAATISRVKDEMSQHNWVHFACHAVQDREDPLKSGIHLYDGQLQLLELLKQRFPEADHAFLSACETGKGDKLLSDEAAHVAAGLLAAGYRSVVATMWSIRDQHGPEIAETFYRVLLESGELNSACASHALRKSMQRFRKRYGDTEYALLTWIPYVHLGI
jgi:CHAT domain-containing protein